MDTLGNAEFADFAVVVTILTNPNTEEILLRQMLDVMYMNTYSNKDERSKRIDGMMEFKNKRQRDEDEENSNDVSSSESLFQYLDQEARKIKKSYQRSTKPRLKIQ